MRAYAAQTRAEVMMTLRRGDAVLLTIGIPVLLLVFFSLVHVLPTTYNIENDAQCEERGARHQGRQRQTDRKRHARNDA